MKFSKKDLLDIPVIALLAANMIPLFGVLFLNWDAFCVVMLYWAENLVIGFYNVLKMAFAAVPQPVAHLTILVVLKTVLDVKLHNRSHRIAATA